MGVDPEKGAEFMAQLMSNETDHLQALNARLSNGLPVRISKNIPMLKTAY